MTEEEAIRLLSASRGCHCCTEPSELDRLLPDDCPRAEWMDGEQDHTYDPGCNRHFGTVVRHVLERVRDDQGSATDRGD